MSRVRVSSPAPPRLWLSMLSTKQWGIDDAKIRHWTIGRGSRSSSIRGICLRRAVGIFRNSELRLCVWPPLRLLLPSPWQRLRESLASLPTFGFAVPPSPRRFSPRPLHPLCLSKEQVSTVDDPPDGGVHAPPCPSNPSEGPAHPDKPQRWKARSQHPQHGTMFS